MLGILEKSIMMKFVSAGAAAFLALSNVAGATELRLSHQWSNQDVRHKVAEIVAN
jgi:TRAP-type transport system periplasmic protein